jgi:hypothetical protein
MRTLVLACTIALAAIACGNDDDDDAGAGAGPVVLDTAGFDAGPFDSCDVVGTITNRDDDRFCDVFVAHVALDRAGFVFADSFVSIPDVAPRESVRFEAPLFDSNGDLVSCDEVDRIELDELEAICD